LAFLAEQGERRANGPEELVTGRRLFRSEHVVPSGGEAMLRSQKVVDAGGVTWDDTYDVVVVGAGAAGFPAALNASRHGASVAILEKADEPGGTMKKSAAWIWIPNNSLMRADGKD